MTRFALFALCLAFSASTATAGTCSNPNDQRDAWLAGWVDWIPARDKTAETDGQTFTQAQAIARANKLIPETYKKRGADLNKSQAGMSALMMINAKLNERKARRSFEKTFGKGSFADASACWKRKM